MSPSKAPPRRAFLPAGIVLCTAGLLFGATVPPVLAQSAGSQRASSAAEDAYEEAGWTGRLQDPAIARKEAGAALAEGRRECARQAGDKAACLKKVQDDHAAAIRRLNQAAKR